jgi:predicted nuclease with TOPRIM domain
MSKNKVQTDHDDVVVMFPASKNFPRVEDLQNPIPEMKREIQHEFSRKTFNEKTKLELPSEMNSLTQACHSLEVRLNVLEEVSDRLKFYLDDLETELSKK